MKSKLKEFFRAQAVINKVIELGEESIEEKRLTKSVNGMCMKNPQDKTTRELKIIGNFFGKYKFFRELRASNDEEVYLGVMRYVKF